jgi:hypothetical protein
MSWRIQEHTLELGTKKEVCRGSELIFHTRSYKHMWIWRASGEYKSSVGHLQESP